MAVDRFARDRDAFELPDGDYDFIEAGGSKGPAQVELPELMSSGPEAHLRCRTCGVRLEFSEFEHCTYCKRLLEAESRR
jgi:hypothetical protein